MNDMSTDHRWQMLPGTTTTGFPVVIAVCDRCGLIRRAAAKKDSYVDLRGDCEGEPQAPEGSDQE